MGFLAVFLFVFAAHAFAAEPVNAYCPVTPEEPAESWITTEYEGQTIGFCCKSCLRKFNADPSAYLANLEAKPSASGAQELPGQTSGDHGTSGHHDTDASDVHASSSGEATRIESKDSGGHADAGGEEVGSEGGKESEAETGSDDHDHATDHGSTSGGSGERILALLGKLHVLVPLTAHFGGSLIYGPDYLFDMPVPTIPSAINP